VYNSTGTLPAPNDSEESLLQVWITLPRLPHEPAGNDHVKTIEVNVMKHYCGNLTDLESHSEQHAATERNPNISMSVLDVTEK
jgi:hypothetical protein